MRLSKKLVVLMLIVVTMLGVAACGGSGSSSGKVYYLNHKDGDGFTDSIRDSFAAKAKSAGMQVEFMDAKGDGALQVDQLNAAIAAKPGAIALLAVDGVAIVPTVEKANEAGIPVFITNRTVAGGKVISSMSDDVESGRMQGEYMAKNLPQGAKIVYLEGEEAHSASAARWAGFKETCLDKRPDIQLLSSAVGNWNASDALRNMTLWLKLFPQIDGVVAANDDMAIGAIQALKDAGRLNGCLISGVNATDDALRLVQSGEMSQTVKQDAVGQADGLFTLIDACLKGKMPTENITVPFTSITKDNIAQFAK